MKLASFTAAVVLVAICGCKDKGAIKAGDKSESHAVHEVAALAIIQKVSSGEIKGPYVLQETPSLSVFVLGEDKKKEFAKLQERLAGIEVIGQELAAKFVAANRDPETFRKDAFPTEFPGTLLSAAKLEALFSNGADDGWQRFHQEFGSFGMVTASLPVFTEDGRSALMMIWHQYGPLHGEGGFVMAKRVGSSWTIFNLTSAPSGVSSVPDKQVDANRLHASTRHEPRHRHP